MSPLNCLISLFINIIRSVIVKPLHLPKKTGMPLIKSISGIRGTIGGIPGKGLTPMDIVKYTASYAAWLNITRPDRKHQVIVGRDARISGEMVNYLVVGTFLGAGVDVVDIGLTTTPTAELAVLDHQADGGLILTASHNPMQWNALKLLNSKGEFLSAKDGEQILAISEAGNFSFIDVYGLGIYSRDESQIQKHINKIIDLPLVDVTAIKNARFSVVIDAVNSTGGLALPPLLKALGVDTLETMYGDPSGIFPHNPEPLPENIRDICERIINKKADVGFVVDPDVDRLAIINEIGEPLGEEYTLVMIADYILKHTQGNTVSNLSSTQALQIITEKEGSQYYASAVGEVNVVELMKEKKAVIGGEGNGGVIYPELHYGRDALVGIALFLTALAKSGQKCSNLRDQYPNFYISKNKIEFSPEQDIDQILLKIMEKYKQQRMITLDGIKIFFDREWVHLRRSNTEPIVRVYAESDALTKAEILAKKIIGDFSEILQEY